MPKTGLTHNTELATRNAHTKVAATVSLSVDGRELPNMSVLGDALEEAVELIQKKITESYQVVPARTGTPVADVYGKTT